MDDLLSNKLRPALCLTKVINPHKQLIVGMISSNIHAANPNLDLLLLKDDIDFEHTGLQRDSVVKLTRVVTISVDIVLRKLGTLPAKYSADVERKLKLIFDLDCGEKEQG